MAVDAEEAPEEFFFLHIKLEPSSLAARSICASMLSTSCIVFIQQCYRQGLINDIKKENLEDYIMTEEVHCEIRNLMITLVPKQLEDGKLEAAYVKDIVSRVKAYI